MTVHLLLIQLSKSKNSSLCTSSTLVWQPLLTKSLQLICWPLSTRIPTSRYLRYQTVSVLHLAMLDAETILSRWQVWLLRCQVTLSSYRLIIASGTWRRDRTTWLTWESMKSPYGLRWICFPHSSPRRRSRSILSFASWIRWRRP